MLFSLFLQFFSFFRQHSSYIFDVLFKNHWFWFLNPAQLWLEPDSFGPFLAQPIMGRKKFSPNVAQPIMGQKKMAHFGSSRIFFGPTQPYTECCRSWFYEFQTSFHCYRIIYCQIPPLSLLMHFLAAFHVLYSKSTTYFRTFLVDKKGWKHYYLGFWVLVVHSIFSTFFRFFKKSQK